jgi:hypothetical protein
MNTLPFQLTDEALNHIRERSRPRPGTRPSLTFALGFEEYEEDGRLAAKLDRGH